MNEPKVAIIILVYNGAQYLGDCLSSLANLNYPKEKLAIIVVDNASTDNSVETVNKKQLTVDNLILIKNEVNLGFAAGNNVGIKYAMAQGFDYVYLLNQDTVTEPNFLIEAVKVAESDEQISAVQSRLMLYQKKDVINSIGNQIHYLGFAYAGGHGTPITHYSLPVPSFEITYPSGAAVLLKLSTLEKVGLFNEEFFMYHEDVDLGWRLWLQNYKVMLVWDSVVYHKYEFSKSIKKYYFMERNRYLVLLQNYKMATLLAILPASIVMDISMFIYSIFAGWFSEELEVYKYFFSHKNWEKIFETRQKIQASRKTKDKEIIKRFVGVIKFQDFQNPLLKYFVNPIFDLYWQIVKRLIWW